MFLCIPSKADLFKAFHMVYVHMYTCTYVHYVHITLRKAMDHMDHTGFFFQQVVNNIYKRVQTVKH